MQIPNKKTTGRYNTLFVKSEEETEGESARQLAAPRKRAPTESDLLEAPSISGRKRCLLQLRSTRDEGFSEGFGPSGDWGMLCLYRK